MHPTTIQLATLAVEAAPFFLVSFWKPILLLATFAGWAYIIAKIYDKHAARFFLPRRRWNTIHMAAGAGAIFIAMLIPWRSEGAFWVGWFVMIVILAADLLAYALVANKDERVPEQFHIKLDMESLAEAKEAKKAAKLQAKVALKIISPDKQVVPAPVIDTPEYEVRAAAEGVYQKAMLSRAAQVDFAPVPSKDGGLYGLSLLVDGVRQPLQTADEAPAKGQAAAPGLPNGTLPVAQAMKIMDFWRAAAKLDVADRRRRQQDACTVEHDGVKHTVRVTSVGAQGGLRLTMLFDPEQAVLRKPADIGLLPAQLAELKAMVTEGKGVVLLAAGPDSGRTTTLYSTLQLHDAYTQNVHTVEEDPQASIDGVRVNKFEALKEGAEHSTLVRSVLRRDPDVVFLADLRDQATAKELVRADLTRTRIYVSLRADGAIAAIEAWAKTVGEARAAGAALHGVVAQKLLRKLCTNCRVAYPPPPDMLKKLGISDKVQQLFKKGGQVLIKNKPEVCPVCHGAGYLGQEGVFEVYPLGEDDRELIATGNLSGLRAALRKKATPSLQAAAITKAINGVTSVEEVTRVTAPSTPPNPPPPAPGSAAPRPATPAPTPVA